MNKALAKFESPVKEYHPLPAFLSYLGTRPRPNLPRPNCQRRVIFFVCLYVLFFYGQFLGSGSATLPAEITGDVETTFRIHSNVYLPDAYAETAERRWPSLAHNLYTRPQFLGQFWIGMAAWPAVYQYMTLRHR